jgi:hypothetical protein
MRNIQALSLSQLSPLRFGEIERRRQLALRYPRYAFSSVRSIYLFFDLDLHLPNRNSDAFQEYAGRDIWGNRKIKLFDTTFWEKLSKDPDRYRDGFMKKNNLLECDFAVIPMFKLYRRPFFL